MPGHTHIVKTHKNRLYTYRYQSGRKHVKLFAQMEKIFKLYKETYDISEQDWEIFSSKLVKQTFPKKTNLLLIGETEQYLSFVDDGIIRFYIPKGDSDLTFGFVFSGSFMCAYDSFLTQNPSIYSVQTITNTTLWRLGYKDLQEIYNKTEIGNLIGRITAENLFLNKAEREISLLINTPEERYLKIFKERPELIEKIPLKYIASYIGITPQALSRIRRRIY